MSVLWTYAKGTAASAVTLGTIGVGLLYYGQNYMIYPGHIGDSRTAIPKPSDFGLPYEQLTLDTSDNIKIKSYLIMQEADAASRPTIIMFHGNGGNYGQRTPLAKVFWSAMRCNVAMLCYRGYGDSEGSASEKGFQIDSQTLLDYVTKHEVLSKTKLFLYGQSIGGAVAIDLASRNTTKIHAMILENTFTALPKLVPNAIPVLGPFAWLCHQKWPSEKRLPLIPSKIPILMLAGKEDMIVPHEHMKELWEISLRSGRENGVWVEFAGRGHNDTCATREYWEAVAAFVKANS